MLMYEEDHIKDSSGDEPEPLDTLYGVPAAPASEPDQSNIDMVEATDPMEEVSISFEQPTIDQDTWIQSKSYSYSVSGSDNGLTRSETADENGAVTGTYTIPDVNGDPIVVKYRAGPLTGFVIENFDEVQARTDPASASVSQ